MAKESKHPFDIYIKERTIFNRQIDEAYSQPEVEEAEGYDKVHQARKWLCANYWDIRTFGALMTSGKNAGQVLVQYRLPLLEASNQ